MFNTIHLTWPVLLLGLLFPAGIALAHGDHGDMDHQAMTKGMTTITTASSDQYGTYLVTGKGMSVYLFKGDTRGSGESTCYDKCAKFWPPVLTDKMPMAKGEAVADKLGTIERKDGSMQVTYNGWPLYLFIKDQAPGDTAGQDVHGFGADWYLVTPQGTAVHAEEEDGGNGY